MGGDRMIELMIADDDPIIVKGLEMIVGSQEDMVLVATAHDGAHAVAACRSTKVDVAILDIRMPVMDGIQAARILLEEDLAAPLLLTTFDEPELIDRALEVGARGYILKNGPAERLLATIRTVAQGGTVFAPDILEYIRSVAKAPAKDKFNGLTARELEIVQLIAKGLSNGEIADQLFISNGTVRNYISAILEKTGLEHRTQIAVRYYTGAGDV